MNNKIVVAICFTLFSQIIVGMHEQQMILEQKGQLSFGEDRPLSNEFKHSVVHARFYHKDLMPNDIVYYRAFLGLGFSVFTNQNKNIVALQQINKITGKPFGDESLWSELIVKNKKPL
jgi:hypothetical protein